MSSSSNDEAAGMPCWWLAEMGRPPLGPLNQELLLEWCKVGLVGADALICAVGEQTWRPVEELQRLVTLGGGVATESGIRRTRFDRSKERCELELEPLPPETESLDGDGSDSVPPDSRTKAVPPELAFSDWPSEVTRVEVPKPATRRHG
ncbi:MAG TPA: hypothetical protein VHU80_08215 [Polyangiaceae bacterium]|jgi:hypothetical protein|nr:hypothetical protein [Polyangiaceae bacterium]